MQSHPSWSGNNICLDTWYSVWTQIQKKQNWKLYKQREFTLEMYSYVINRNFILSHSEGIYCREIVQCVSNEHLRQDSYWMILNSPLPGSELLQCPWHSFMKQTIFNAMKFLSFPCMHAYIHTYIYTYLHTYICNSFSSSTPALLASCPFCAIVLSFRSFLKMLLMWQVSWTAARISTCLTSGEEGGLGKYRCVNMWEYLWVSVWCACVHTWSCVSVHIGVRLC